MKKEVFKGSSLCNFTLVIKMMQFC